MQRFQRVLDAAGARFILPDDAISDPDPITVPVSDTVSVSSVGGARVGIRWDVFSIGSVVLVLFLWTDLRIPCAVFF